MHLSKDTPWNVEWLTMARNLGTAMPPEGGGTAVETAVAAVERGRPSEVYAADCGLLHSSRDGTSGWTGCRLEEGSEAARESLSSAFQKHGETPTLHLFNQ